MNAPLCALLLALLCLPLQSLAGAWPREEGTGFISLSQEARDTVIGTVSVQSIYAEYGLNDRLTLGLRANRRADGLAYSALAFARYPISPQDWSHKFAVELAAGTRWNIITGHDLLVRPALHWGKGFQSPEPIAFLGSGWMGAEASLGHAFGNVIYKDETWAKADFTVGFTPREETHLILQLRSHHNRWGSSYSLAPSFVHRFTKYLKLEIGGIWQLSGNAGHSLTAATWIEF